MIIGAGSAGLLAAIGSGARGASTLLLEKNAKPGKKLGLRTGLRRFISCYRNAPKFLEDFGKGADFLRPSITAFPGTRLVDLLERRGVKTEVFGEGAVRSAGNRAGEVVSSLIACAAEHGVTTRSSFNVDGIEHTPDATYPFFVRDRKGHGFEARRVIVSTGGMSQPETGSTGEALQWLRELKHTIVAPAPALVGLMTKGMDLSQVDGVVVDDVELELLSSQFRSRLACERGEFKVTSTSIVGVATLNISIDCVTIGRGQNLVLKVDFVPDVKLEQLLGLIASAVQSKPQRLISDALSGDALPNGLPRRLISALIGAAFPGLRTAKCINFPIATRRLLAERIKGFEFEITGSEGFKAALATDGGVLVDEVNPRTMESTIVPGLHLAGEVLDITGRYGGFNGQAAFATGLAAGDAAARAVGAKGPGLEFPDSLMPPSVREPSPAIEAAKAAKVEAAKAAAAKAEAARIAAERAAEAKAEAAKVAAARAEAVRLAAAKAEAAKADAAKAAAAKAAAAKVAAAKAEAARVEARARAEANRAAAAKKAKAKPKAAAARKSKAKAAPAAKKKSATTRKKPVRVAADFGPSMAVLRTNTSSTGKSAETRTGSAKASGKNATAKKTAAKKSSTARTATGKTAKKTSGKKAVKKAATRKTTTKKAATKKAATKKAATKKAATKKAATKKAATKKAATKSTAGKKAAEKPRTRKTTAAPRRKTTGAKVSSVKTATKKRASARKKTVAKRTR